MLFGRHIVELNATNNTPVRGYVWGLDLSGSLDGAGGVGGLLWVTLHTASGLAAGTHFVAYDGNGNVVALVSANTGTETARYEYGPFGEPIRVTGPAAALNPFRFSTKRTDSTTDLVLYEYRAYSPTIGRWVSRDPIEEEGGVNLAGVAGNDFLNSFDVLGAQVHRWKVKRVMPLDNSCNYFDSDAGYGGVLWTIRWIITIRGTAYDYHVAASGEAEASRFRTKRAEVTAWVFFGCDQGGNILVTSMCPGGLDKNGSVSAIASVSVQISGDTASVEYTSGAAWESGLSISPGIGIRGATINVTASSGGRHFVQNGWAMYKCVCGE
jgi:RHS repeat-associated protein